MPDEIKRPEAEMMVGGLIMLAFIIGTIFSLAIIKIVFGDSEDPAGYCFHNEYPYRELCKEQRQSDQQQIKKLIHEACDLDESLCVLGKPDPDICEFWNDTRYQFGPDDQCFDK